MFACGPVLGNETRWWSHHEEYVCIGKNGADIADKFVPSLLAQGICPAASARLADILFIPDVEILFVVEVWATIEFTRPFIKATYDTEGNGFESLHVFNRISALGTHCDMFSAATVPHTMAIALQRTGDPKRAAVLVQEAIDKMQGGIDYFRKLFEEPGCAMEQTNIIFKAIRLFDPQQSHLLRATDSNPDPLLNLYDVPIIKQTPLLYAALVREAPVYLQLATELVDEMDDKTDSEKKNFDRLAWYKRWKHKIPAWARAGLHHKRQFVHATCCSHRFTRSLSRCLVPAELGGKRTTVLVFGAALW